MFPNRDTPSPEPLPKQGDSILSFVHSRMSAGVPKEEPSYIHTGKNIRSLSTEPPADGRPTYSGVRPGSPRGSLMTLLSLPQYHAAFGMIPSFSDSNVVHFDYLFLPSSYVIPFVLINVLQVRNCASQRHWSPA